MKQFLLLLVAASSQAATFHYARNITPAPGANRLTPDAALLSGGQPLRYEVSKQPSSSTETGDDRLFTWRSGLSDLRLADAHGVEVPYLLLSPPAAKASWKSGAILPVASSKTASGFETDLGSSTNVDALRVDGIAPPFLKRARLEGSGDRAHWTVLAAETTLFDLPEQELRHTLIDFPAGDYRYLRVTFDDRNSARVGTVAGAAARIHTLSSPALGERVPVRFVRDTSEPGKSRYHLTLPGKHLPVIAIEIETVRGNVYRAAEVREQRLTDGVVMPLPLGKALLRMAQRDGGVAASLSVPVAFPDGPDLELLIDDGNNPPLAITAITARLAPLPVIYFESPDNSPLVARYGNEETSAARYDLEASREKAMHAAAPAAKWTNTVVPETINSEEAPLPTVGASVDRRRFRYARPVPSSPRGLTSLLLDGEVLARSRTLADVRLVDGQERQVPYLIEHPDAPLMFPMGLPAPSHEGNSSSYPLALPYDFWPNGTRLVIRTSARVFERHVTLRRPADERRNREAQIITDAMWRNADPSMPAAPLTIGGEFSGSRVLELVVDEGDNAPLAIAGAELLAPATALRFYDPGTPLTLLYGNSTLAPPRYDLSLLAPRLFGESARQLALTSPAVPEANPSGRERKIFWVVIASAAVILLVLLARLIKTQPA